MLTLVILAAGMGSRFGAVKQLVPVGPEGETILEFNVSDAIEAGFQRVVIVTRPELGTAMRTLTERTFGRLIETRIAIQRIPEGRSKPLGSAEAVATAANHVEGYFTVANADDVYGPSAFEALASMARTQANLGCVVAYRLADTAPTLGAVTRALLQVEGDRLTDLVETPGITREGEDRFAVAGTDRRLDGNEWVSMNLWGLPFRVMKSIQAAVKAFGPRSGTKAEIFLPEVLRQLNRNGQLALTWVAAGEPWTGITNPDDLETVRSFLRVTRPAGLWAG